MMKKFVAILYLLLCTKFLYGQEKQINIQTYENGDTTLWYTWRYELSTEIGIPHLINSSKPFYFRLWTDGQALGIWLNEDSTSSGQITSWTKEVDIYGKLKNKKPYSTTVGLDSSVIRQLFNLIDSADILNIPTQDAIEGWVQGEDGVTYLTELSTPTKYIFKEYWTPSAQENIREAEVILRFVEKAQEIADMSKHDDDFFLSLPIGCYSTGSIMMRCKQ